MERLTLASGSPRRQEILTNLGLNFTVLPANIDEIPQPSEDPQFYALRMAVQKAMAAANKVESGLIIGADTIVVVDGQIMGKPRDVAEAAQQLRALSGREHIVFSGLGIVDKTAGRTVSTLEQTIVYFREMSDAEIQSYIRTGEPLDKAGSYGIQGKGAVFIRRIEGDYFNVVGLPIAKLYSLLAELDYELFS